jgi:hypothetical protein
MAEDITTHFKVSVHNLKIDPKLGIMDQGNIDIKPPPLSSETDDAHMPAVIGMDRPAPKKKTFFVRKAGATLAEQLGTEEAVEVETTVQHLPTQPINVPDHTPAKNLTADEMGSMLTPKFKAPVEEPDKPIVQPEVPAIPEPVTPLKADLKDLVLRYIQKVGPEEAAKFFGKPAMHIHNWVNGKGDPPLAAAQAILDRSPKAREHYLKVVEKVYIDFETGEGSFQRDHTREDLPVDLCLCTDKDLPPYVHWVFVTASAQYGLGQKMQTDTVLIRARNMVADMFLGGKAQWSIWLDYDVLPTIGNAPWWRAITRNLGSDASVGDKTASYDFIKRLLSHNKPFVGGVYATRRKGGPLVTQLDLHPRGQADRIASDQQRKNKANGLYGPVEWLSCGFAVIHRVVFETIKKQHPERIPTTKGEPYPFFTPIGSEGEDVAFSKRAIEAGFKLYLDQELFAAHIGRYPFLPGESAFNGNVEFTNAHM